MDYYYLTNRHHNAGNEMINHSFKLLLITSSLILNGCAVALIGGAGVGGYYLGEDERTIGQITNDASITATIKTDLIRDDDISGLDIDVDTYRGVVVLNGHVPSKSLAARSIKLASVTKGVKKVVSKLVVIP